MSVKITLGPRVKKPLLIVVLALLVYVAGTLALPALIMTSSTPNAELTRVYNAVYAPVVAAARDVPVLGSVWAAYMRFLCRVNDYSCDNANGSL